MNTHTHTMLISEIFIYFQINTTNTDGYLHKRLRLSTYLHYSSTQMQEIPATTSTAAVPLSYVSAYAHTHGIASHPCHTAGNHDSVAYSTHEEKTLLGLLRYLYYYMGKIRL